MFDIRVKGSFHPFVRISLLAIFLVNGFLYIPRQSHISDESAHHSYGVRILKGTPQKTVQYIDPSCMPVSALNALPRATQQIMNPSLEKSDWGRSDVLNGRYVSLFVSLLIGFLILVWARELYGERAGTFSLFLFVFCPNLNAHAGLLTTDNYAALAVLASSYFYYKYTRQHSWLYLILLSLSLGFAQITKQSLTILLPLFALIALARWVYVRERPVSIRRSLPQLLAAVLIILFVINAGFLFDRTFTPLADYKFYSETFRDLQASLAWAGSFPMPLPVSYLEGLDQVKHMLELGAGDVKVSPPNYILGENRVGEGFWYYYFIILFFKTPISVLLLLGFLVFRAIAGSVQMKFAEWYIVSILLFFFLFFSVMTERQVGIRHILMVYPLLYVLIGRILPDAGGWTFRIPVLIYSVATFYFYFPNLIAYTNEFIFDKKNAYKVMADSNLDWGQGEKFLEKYLASHKEVKRAEDGEGEGTYIVGMSEYVGYRDPKVEWIRKYKPFDHVYFSYLLIKVPARDIIKNNE